MTLSQSFLFMPLPNHMNEQENLQNANNEKTHWHFCLIDFYRRNFYYKNRAIKKNKKKRFTCFRIRNSI